MRMSAPRHHKRQLIRRLFGVAGLLLVFCLVISSAYAQCTNPPGNDGTKEWFAASGGGGPSGCSSIGDVCSDGSIFAGDTDLYVTDTNQSTSIKWSTKTVNTGADSTSDGQANQQWIVDNETLSQYPAFEICENLNRHGHTDWYLPAQDEFNVLYTNRAAIGGFTTGVYWGSTETGTTTGWGRSFTTGNQGANTKTYNLRVRCVRRDSGGGGSPATYKFCIDGNWIDLTEDGTLGSCTTESQWDYDTTEKAFKQCDGTDWKKIGCSAGGGGGSSSCGDVVSGGYLFSCAIGSDSKGYCWGNNQNGQLGDNTTTQRNTPVIVQNGASPGTFKQISASTTYSPSMFFPAHTCAIGTDDKAYCWGANGTYGLLGDNTTTQRLTPVAVLNGASPGTFKQISSGPSHTCAIGADNKAYCWGYNGYGQLGDNTTTQRSTPVLVLNGAGPGTYKYITAGAASTCAIGTDDKAYCWGDNSDGQLGDNTTTQRLTPVLVLNGAGPGTYLTIESGQSSSSIPTATPYGYRCAIGTDDKAYCWGSNFFGNLGDNTTTQRNTPILVLNGAGPGTYTDISVGVYHTCGIGTDSKAYCWGYNTSGQLGDNTTTQRNVPVAVLNGASPGSFKYIDNGSSHTCAVASDNKAYCWGTNVYGGLGDNTTTQRNTPVAVLTGAGLGALAEPACGGGGSCTSLGSCSVEGRMEYDTVNDVMMYCDGTDWYPLAEATP